jgi:hypothetical protein
MGLLQERRSLWWIGVSCVVLLILLSVLLPVWAVNLKTLETLEITSFGRKFPKESEAVRIHRLEQKFHLSAVPKASLQYRLESLYQQQHTLVPPQLEGAALHAYNTGVERTDQKDMAGAEEAYREAIRLNPKLIQAYNNLATLLEEQNDDSEGAAKLYQTALQYSPEEPLLYRNLGITYEKLGRVEQALEMYRHYLRITPEPDPPIASIIANIDANHNAASRQTDYVPFATSATQGHDILWPPNRPIPIMIRFTTPEQASFVPTVQRGMKHWEEATHGDISFDETAVTPPYGIVLTLQDGPLSHPFLDIGHAEYQMKENQQLKVMVRVNIGEPDSSLSFADREQQISRLVLHELGHAIGIWGHSPDPKDIMYTRPIVSALSQRDVRTINRLYHLE